MTADADTVTGGLMASATFYAMQSVVPSKFTQLKPFIASLRAVGPVNTVQ